MPLSFNDFARDDYNSAMIAVYELQNIHPILDLYVFSYLKTCQLYDQLDTVRIAGLGITPDDLRAWLSLSFR